MIKFSYSEKVTKFWKNHLPIFLKKSPTCFDKTAFFSQYSVKTSGIFFQIFVAFSEKLDFNSTIVPKFT